MSPAPRLRILMLSPIPIAPMNAGDRVRIWHLAHGLARHSTLTLVVPEEEAHVHRREQAPFRWVGVPWTPPRPWQKLKSLLSSWPYHVALRYHPTLAQTVNTLLRAEHYDLIYCHFLSTLPYAVGRGLPVLWDQHNIDRIYWQHKVTLHHVHSWRQALIQWNRAKVRRLEEQMFPKVAGIVSVSPTDQAITQQLLPTPIPCLVAPNGVDTAYYQPATQARPAPPTASAPLVLGFFGSLDLELNQRAAVTLIQQILPGVVKQLPERRVSLIVLGRNPPPWLHELVARTAYPAITLTGTVDDVRPYLHQMDLLVLPLAGGAGTKLRVVEAMAAGVSIVGSDFALMGVDEAATAQICRRAQTAEEFVTAICVLARDPRARQQMVLRARQVVEERYRWEGITQQLAEELTCILAHSA